MRCRQVEDPDIVRPSELLLAWVVHPCSRWQMSEACHRYVPAAFSSGQFPDAHFSVVDVALSLVSSPKDTRDRGHDLSEVIIDV